MLTTNLKIYILKFFILSFFIFIFSFFLFLHFNNTCDLKKHYQISKSFGFKTSITLCKTIVSSIIKSKISFNNSSKKTSSKDINLSRDDIFKLKNIKNKNTIPKKINGIIHNLDQFLIEEEEFLKNYLSNQKISNDNLNTWIRSHGGNENLKFSNSKKLNKDTSKNLKLYWKYRGDFKLKNWGYNVETNPIFYDGIIYTVTSDYKLKALDIINKKLKWEIRSPDQIIAKRGFLIDIENKNNPKIFTPVGKKIFKINANSGEIEKNFGLDGSVNFHTLISPFIFNNKICAVGFKSLDCFLKTDGTKSFSIKIHNDDEKGGVPWGGVSYDEKFNIAYIVTGNPRPALIGINRSNKNKYANSLLAIDLKKRKIIWYVKDVFHDLWDYDIAHPPIITNIKFENGFFPGILTVGKTGNVHLLNRLNGRYLFDIDYKKTQLSKIPGEHNSNYQLDITKPEKLIHLDKINSLLENNELIEFGEFIPPSFGKKVAILGLHGGATWPGSSYNPLTSNLFTPVNNYPFVLKIYAKTKSKKIPNNLNGLANYKKYCSNCHGNYRAGTNNPEKLKIKEFMPDYVPSLVGYSILNKEYFLKIFKHESFIKHHPDINIKQKELNDIKNFFTQWDKEIIEDTDLSLKGFWYKLNGNNAVETFLTSSEINNQKTLKPWKKKEKIYPPPWGKIVSSNLKTGKINWEKEIGDVDFNGKTLNGSLIYGGVASNRGGVLVVTGTTDNKVYVLDQSNGDILWDYKMESAGSSPPIIFTIGNKDYIGVVSTGGLFNEFEKKDSIFYVFSIQ